MVMKPQTSKRHFTIEPFSPRRDRAQVVACFVEFQDYERTVEADRPRGKDIAEKYFRGLLKTNREKKGELFVARQDGRVLGIMNIYLDSEPANMPVYHHSYAYVSDLMVTARARRQGIGEALMQHARQWSLTKKMKRLYLNVLSRNTGALKFYHDIGLRDYELLLMEDV